MGMKPTTDPYYPNGVSLHRWRTGGSWAPPPYLVDENSIEKKKILRDFLREKDKGWKTYGKAQVESPGWEPVKFIFPF